MDVCGTQGYINGTAGSVLSDLACPVSVLLRVP